MKHLFKLLFASLFVLAACSQHTIELGENDDFPTDNPQHEVQMNFSRNSLESFAASGISELGVYVYLKDSLISGKNYPLSSGTLAVQLPLGEDLRTFVVANAPQLENVEQLSAATILMDAAMQQEVYLSDVISFTSDKSVSSIAVELKRVVGQAVLQPTESVETLQATTLMDQVQVTFTNAGVAYKVSSGACVQQDVTVTVDRSQNFCASIYSFPTVTGSSRTAIGVTYLRGGEVVNTTNSPLDTAIAFEPSKRSVVYMPILEDAFLTNSWGATRGASSKEMMHSTFQLIESEF